VRLVQQTCGVAALEARVTGSSCRAYGKLTRWVTAEGGDTGRPFGVVRGRERLSFDPDQLTPEWLKPSCGALGSSAWGKGGKRERPNRWVEALFLLRSQFAVAASGSGIASKAAGGWSSRQFHSPSRRGGQITAVA
jgi:hypothetical protein